MISASSSELAALRNRFPTSDDQLSPEAKQLVDGSSGRLFGPYALCLSGGGLRATFFHLGVIRALRRLDRFKGLTHIFSVSGGSILAAHLALNWQKYTGTDQEFEKACCEIKEIGSRDIRNNIVRRWLLALIFPPLWVKMHEFGPTRLLEQEYQKALFRKKTFLDVYEADRTEPRRALKPNDAEPTIDLTEVSDADQKIRPVPDLQILATSFKTGNLCSFSRKGFCVEDKKSRRLYRTNVLPLSLAVAASSAYPPICPPVTITRADLGEEDGPDFPYPSESLTDGGLFDNLGFEQFLRNKAHDPDTPTDLVLSDAGAAFRWRTQESFWWIIRRALRATDILTKRVADQTLQISKGLQSSFRIAHIRIDEQI